MPPCFQHEHHFCQQMFLSFSSCLPSTYKNKTPYPRLNKAWQNKSNFCIVYLYVDLWACPLLTYVDLCWTMLTYGPVLEGEVRRKESKHIFSDDGTLLDLILLHIYNFFFRRAMRAVLGASIIFIILMIPKAVVYFFAIFWDPGVETLNRNGYTKILDVLASTLQYTNHSINLFVYVVAMKIWNLVNQLFTK